MSVLEELHQARKERLARMGTPSSIAPPPTAVPALSLARIQKAVARYFNVSLVDMLSTRRAISVSHPRQVAFYLCRKLTTHSFPSIGRAFKGKDHTTVLHGSNKIEELIKTDLNVAEDVNELTRIIQEEMQMSDADFATLEGEVGEACRAAWMNARALEGYRRHGGARRFLKAPELLDDLEKARDYISRVLDDMRGVR